MSFALTPGNIHACITIGYIAQWLERLTADQQVPGSNPGVPLQFHEVSKESINQGWKGNEKFIHHHLGIAIWREGLC